MGNANIRTNGMSPSQHRIYTAIEQYIKEHCYPPTVRELSALTGLSSTATIKYHLANMRAAGLIDYEPTKPRTLRLLAGTQSRNIPLVSICAEPATTEFTDNSAVNSVVDSAVNTVVNSVVNSAVTL